MRCAPPIRRRGWKATRDPLSCWRPARPAAGTDLQQSGRTDGLGSRMTVGPEHPSRPTGPAWIGALLPPARKSRRSNSPTLHCARIETGTDWRVGDLLLLGMQQPPSVLLCRNETGRTPPPRSEEHTSEL